MLIFNIDTSRAKWGKGEIMEIGGWGRKPNEVSMFVQEIENLYIKLRYPNIRL